MNFSKKVIEVFTFKDKIQDSEGGSNYVSATTKDNTFIAIETSNNQNTEKFKPPYTFVILPSPARAKL